MVKVAVTKVEMAVAEFGLVGRSPYSSSKVLESKREKKEDCREFEKKVWRERMHVSKDGEWVIPAMALKGCLQDIAKYISESIPGKNRQTYTKNFEAGILVEDAMPLGIKAEDAEGEWVFVPSSGKPGPGPRVWKCFPVIQNWSVKAKVYILDPIITEEVFLSHLVDAGKFIGIGRWRPRTRGLYGRFTVENFKFTKIV